MTRKFGSLGSVAAALALAVFTGTALAGNGNENGNQPAAAPGNSANAPGQVKKDAAAPAAQTQAAPTQAAKPSKPVKPAHGNSSAHSSGSTTQAGVKPSNTTAHSTHTTVGANPDVSKRYGNGKTAAQIAKSNGAGDDVTLYGPGNSQPHKVTNCKHPLHGNGGGVDVHAVKSYDVQCATQTQTQQPSVQVTETKVCGAVTTTTTSTRLQRGHAYGLVKHGKPLHSKTVTVTVTLPTGEVCTVSAPTQQSANQQVVQVLTQALGTAPTQEQIAAATKSPSATGKGAVLGVTATQRATPKQAAAKAGRGGVLGAFVTAGHTVARGTLPFTGFPLWVAVLIGAALIAAGLMLARRRGLRDTV